MNLFEEKAENKFKEESDISEKDLDIDLLEDLGKEQFCELDEELFCPLDEKQDFASIEFPIPTEIHVFQQIVPLDIPVDPEEVNEEIVCFGGKECEESEDLEEILEEGEEEYVDLVEKGSEKCDDLEKIREDFDLEENENVIEKRMMLRSKLREAKILAKLRCEIARKEILMNDFRKEFYVGL
uniref:Uncharacterized protein n=1 Tax=Meloidogyne enterolobii TaxID=390850 RepID=A0A6V7WUC7_MELEN|nr:unnamed protein product [Meloidogyne enterolobii]